LNEHGLGILKLRASLVQLLLLQSEGLRSALSIFVATSMVEDKWLRAMKRKHIGSSS
jgi:hypothetical protein